jgi:hypothetical protein
VGRRWQLAPEAEKDSRRAPAKRNGLDSGEAAVLLPLLLVQQADAHAVAATTLVSLETPRIKKHLLRHIFFFLLRAFLF